MPEVKPRLTALSSVGFCINSAISNGHLDSVSFDEIYTGLEQGNLFQFLDTKIPGEFDFSLFEPNSDQCISLHQVLNNIAGGLQGRERQKFGLDNSSHGLSLLSSFILEAMQRKDWV